MPRYVGARGVITPARTKRYLHLSRSEHVPAVRGFVFFGALAFTLYAVVRWAHARRVAG